MHANQPNHNLPGKSGSVWAVNRKLASFCKKTTKRKSPRGFTVEKKGLVQAIFRRLWPLAGNLALSFGLFGLLRPLALAQAHARAAAVFVDEFDARFF